MDVYQLWPARRAPHIAVSEASLELGSVAPGETKTASITVQNDGNRALTISSIASSSAAFSVDRSRLELAPGASADLAVTFASTGRTETTGAAIQRIVDELAKRAP